MSVEEHGDKMIAAIQSLAATSERVFNEPIREVWVGQRVYDALSHSIMTRVTGSADAKDDRGVWHNGIIKLCTHSGNMVTIRRSE